MQQSITGTMTNAPQKWFHQSKLLSEREQTRSKHTLSITMVSLTSALDKIGSPLLPDSPLE